MSAAAPSLPHVLAIDLGTSGPKVAVVGLDGETVGREFEPVPLRLLPGGGAEQGAQAWWEGIVAATRRLRARGSLDGRRIVAVAVTGQWAGTVPVDAAGEPLCDALIWMDARGAAHARRLVGGRIRVRGYSPWRLWRWLRRTGGAPSLSGRDSLGHLLYLTHERPDVAAAASAFLEPVDYIGLRLTGRAATSGVTAGASWLTDNRDPSAVRYDGRLIAAAGIDPAKLPEILPTGSVLGPLCERARDELGLPGGVKAVAGTPDIMSAAVGAGTVEDFATHLYVGTSAWLSCHVPFKRTDPLHNIAALPSATPGRYLACDEQQTAGVCLDRLRQTLLPGSDGYDELVGLAAAVPPGSGRVIFTPWLNGERTPVDDHRLRGGYFNLSLDTTREQLVRATLEGVALNVRWMQRYLERFARRRLDPIAFVGGGARSELWGQVMADVLGRTIRRVAEPADVNLRGAALLAGISLGELEPADVPRRVRVAALHEPRPQTRETYDELFREFRRIYRANRRLYARLNAA